MVAHLQELLLSMAKNVDAVKATPSRYQLSSLSDEILSEKQIRYG